MRQREAFRLLARLGFAARGLLYIIIAWLVIGTGRTADLSEALEFLATGTERTLLVFIIAGFIGYGAWRLADAALNVEDHGEDGKAAVKRIGAAGSGAIYLFLAYQAFQLLSGNGGSDNGGSPEQQAETVMELPAGGLLIGIGAIVLLVAGAWQIMKAAKCSFLDNLDPAAASQDWVKWFGRIGYGSRGVIFIVTAYFVGQAALKGDPSEAGGMQDALAWLSSPVNLFVAAGLFLFGVFSLVEARHRQIHAPDSEDLPVRL